MGIKKAFSSKKLKIFGPIARIAAVYFIGFSLFLFISTIILIFLTKPEREVVVPGVEGRKFVEVYGSLARKGIRPEIKFKDTADLDDGMILNQYPKKGTVVPEGRKLELLVTRSQYHVEVPNLIGKELPLALNNLKRIHHSGRSISLGAGVISYIPTDAVADNIVIDQSPLPGEKVAPDRKINILVSTGKPFTDNVMPGIVGQSIDLCYDLLRAKGFVVAEEVLATDDRNTSGLIVAQTPQKGGYVQNGGVVRVKVNWYPLDSHPYTAYEKIDYRVPDDAKPGLFEAYIDDGRSKRIRFSRRARPGQKIVFIFRRVGNAHISFRSNKKEIDEMDINVD
jgi:beta-lactam-binding protein with PASTA domain